MYCVDSIPNCYKYGETSSIQVYGFNFINFPYLELAMLRSFFQTWHEAFEVNQSVLVIRIKSSKPYRHIAAVPFSYSGAKWTKQSPSKMPHVRLICPTDLRCQTFDAPCLSNLRVQLSEPGRIASHLAGRPVCREAVGQRNFMENWPFVIAPSLHLHTYRMLSINMNGTGL